MRRMFSDSRSGFSLVELLVAISLVLLLSALTLGGLHASRTHQVVAQAAARFEMLLELAQAAAMSEGDSFYLVIADHQSRPAGVPMRAYTFIRDPEDPELRHHWQFLPRGLVFARDPGAPAQDLMDGEPLRTLENAFTGEAQGSRVEGQLRVLLELTPEGMLRSGPGRELQSASILLERGSWVSDAASNRYYLPSHTVEEGVPFDAVRVNFRPRSGVMQIEQVLP